MDGAYREAIALMVRVTPMARRDHPNQVDYCLKVSSSNERSHDVDIIHLDHPEIQAGARGVVTPSIAGGAKSRSHCPPVAMLKW